MNRTMTRNSPSSTFRKLAACILLFLTLAGCTQQRLQSHTDRGLAAFDVHDFDEVRDLAGENSTRGLLARAVLLSMQGRDSEAAASLEIFIRRVEDPWLVARARRALSGVLIRQGEYAKAAAAMQANFDVQGTTGVNVDSGSLAFFSALGSVGPMLLGGPDSDSVDIDRDKAGLATIPVKINGMAAAAVLDTGAPLSTVNVTQANAMGLRQLGSDVQVAGATNYSVKAGLAVADTLSIGERAFRNVPFIVVPDESMAFPQFDYIITTIVGLPIIYRLGRIEIGRDVGQETLSFTRSDTTPDPAKMNVLTSGWDLVALGVLNDAPRQQRFLLDTGANTSEIYKLATETVPGLIDGLSHQNRTQGGLGETVVHEETSIESVTLRFGGQTFSHGPIFLVDDNGSARHGAIGQDILSRFDSVILDFGAMTLRLE